METAACLFRLSLCASVILLTHGYPTKESESQDQSSRDSDRYASHHGETGGTGGYHSPMSFGASRHVFRPVQGASSPQFVYADSSSDSVSSMPGAGYPVFMSVEYPSSSQTEAAQSSPPETKWSVEPKIFSEEGLANTEAVGSSNFVPALPPPAPSGPVLQSGETSNVVKEAELGNYQHETEELGYPDDRMGPGFSSYPLASPFLPSVHGFGRYPGVYPYPYPYPVFDYRLLYGLYPPGTYTTFSKNQEKGKDYYQSIHYLKEHGPDYSDVPSGQRKEIFPWAA